MQSLCWTCYKSDKNGCSWARDFIPIKGWEVDEKILTRVHCYDNKRFIVVKCPEFLEERGIKND